MQILNLIARLHAYEPKRFKQVTKKKEKKREGATLGIANIQIHAINEGIYSAILGNF